MQKINTKRIRSLAFKRLIKYDLEHLRDFVRASESFLAEKVNKFSDWVDKGVVGLSDDEKEYHYGWYTDTYMQLSEIFPAIQRSSLFISIMSFFESRLNSLCDLFIDKKSPIAIKVSDLNGKGNIDRAMLFLRKVAKLDINTNTKIWESMRTYQKIRNHLVHANDRSVKESDIDAIKKYAKSEGGIKLDERNQIELDAVFLDHVLNVTERMLNQLFVAIENAMQQKEIKKA